MKLYDERLKNLLPWKKKDVPEDIPHGDMPGDKIEIGPEHIAKANTIFPELVKGLLPVVSGNPHERAVVSVCGGSGVGKSEIASVLAYFLNSAGIGAYILSGDNYPHRIPEYNDAERLHVFRESGIRGLVASGDMNKDHFEKLHHWQEEETDADRMHLDTDPWMQSYLNEGRKGLENYLGTPKETDFAEVSTLVRAFKEGAESLWLRRMGRDACALWYDEVDLKETQVLIIEWTHGNSDYLEGVDLPILLNSTPEETLAHRRARNRDGKTDSAFTSMVLEIEQKKLHTQAHKAKIICSKQGTLLSYDEYRKQMDGKM